MHVLTNVFNHNYHSIVKPLKKFLPEVFLILLTFFVWGKILTQIPTGEGYYYFNPNQNFFSQKGFLHRLTDLSQLDIFAKIFFDIFPPLFKDNLSLYMLAQLLIMTLLYLTIYWTFRKITNSKLLALLIAFFFLASYAGSGELLGTGGYQRFIQRLPTLILVVLSFLALNNFLTTKKFKVIFISFFLFFLAVSLAHFTFLTLPLFVAYLLVKIFEKKLNLTEAAGHAGIALIFSLFAFLLVIQSTHAPQSRSELILSDPWTFIQIVAYQIPTLVFPEEVVISLANSFPEVGKYPYIIILQVLLAVIGAFYTLMLFLIKKNTPKLTSLYITAFLALVGSMAFYSFTDDRLNPFINYGSGRHYFIASFSSAIMSGIIVFTLIKTKKMLLRILALIFIMFYLIYNTYHIWRTIDTWRDNFLYLKEFIILTKNLAPEFNQNTVIIAPSKLLWPADFIANFYGSNNVNFISPGNGWEDKYKNVKQDVFVFDLDQKNGAVLLNLTSDYRADKKILFKE